MPEPEDDIIEELEEPLTEEAEVPEEPDEEPAPPAYVTREEFTSLLTEALKNVLPTQQPVAQEQPKPEPADERNPFIVAREEMEAQGIYDSDAVNARALQIGNERATKQLMAQLMPVLQPAVQVGQSHKFTQMAEGDTAVAAELQAMFDQGALNHGNMNDPQVVKIALAAAKQFASEKAPPAEKAFAAGAPISGKTAGGGAARSGLWNKLAPDERKALSEDEKKYGVTYDDNDIREIFRGDRRFATNG